MDLFLTVARNLLASGTWPVGYNDRKGQLKVTSHFTQEEQVRAVLELIQAERIQVPFKDSRTSIYGGLRYVDYSQFRPRGRYAKNPRLIAYFRAMMWLGRADCGFVVLPSDPVDGLEEDPVRELQNAALLTMVVQHAQRLPNLGAMTRLIARFVGPSDNLTVSSLCSLLGKQGITHIAALADHQRIESLATEIREGDLARQMIRSQALISPRHVPYTIPPPAEFQMFGQRFVIDSFILSNVVYDSILYDGKKQERMMPKGLDVMAALGNSEAIPLLEPELRQWKYSGNLMATAQFVDLCRPQYWQENLYSVWLDTIRELDADLTNVKTPQVMRTRMWQKKQLQTQLASWSELRHDMALYAKQSYTGVPGCEYPAGYVEPYPEFFGKLRQFTEKAQDAIKEVSDTGQNLTQRPDIAAERHLGFLARMRNILGRLETIARKQLAEEPLSREEESFLQQTIDQRGSVSFGSGSRPRYDGWFCDLFFNRLDVRKWNPTIIDVHTFPNSMGESLVLQAGVGDVNLCVLAVDCKGKTTAYVGPVYSYYEFEQPANHRLTDQEWQERVVSNQLPNRPTWSQGFRAASSKRTVDRVAISVQNKRIQLVETTNNQPPRRKEFHASDAGVRQLVGYLVERKRTERITLDLSRARISDQVMTDLAKLPRLVFVEFPSRGVSRDGIEKFRQRRPQVHVRPEPFQLVKATLCKSVSAHGVYQPLDAQEITSREPLHIYVELTGVPVSRRMGSYKTNLELVAQVVNERQEPVMKSQFPSKREYHGLPRGFYISGKILLVSDKKLERGSYSLELAVTSKVVTQRYAQQSRPSAKPIENPTVRARIDFRVVDSDLAMGPSTP